MRILVTDFDKTYFTDEIKQNVKLSNEFIKNNIFIIATGRPFYLIQPELKKYNVKYSYLICNDGGVIFDSNDEIVDKTNVDYNTAIQIYNELIRDSNYEHIYIDAIHDFGNLDSKDYNGVLALPYDREKAEKLIKRINKKYPLAHAYLSHKWVNVLSIDASKGNAIKFLENNNSWDSNDIYVIGDNLNDLSMLIYENSYGVEVGKEEFLKKCNHRIKNFSELINLLKK